MKTQFTRQRSTVSEKYRRNNENKRNYPHNKWLWMICKARAIRHGTPFDLKIEDVIVPTRCPVLGLKLIKSRIRAKENSATIDRINPQKGYTKDNIVVMSMMANRMKSNATFREIKKLYQWSVRQNKRVSSKNKK